VITDPIHVVLVAAVIIGAAVVKGLTGFGFPLIAVPLLSALLSPRVVIPMIALPALLSNAIMVSRGGSWREARSFLAIFAALAIGTIAGAQLVKVLDPHVLSVLVGVSTLAYVAAAASRLTVRASPGAVRRVGPLVALISGAMGGATGILGPMLASYLDLLGLEKREFVFWMTLMFSASNITQIVIYAHLGLYEAAVVTMGLAACLPMVIGTWLGIVVQDRLTADIFKRIVLIVVFAASINLLYHGLVR